MRVHMFIKVFEAFCATEKHDRISGDKGQQHYSKDAVTLTVVSFDGLS